MGGMGSGRRFVLGAAATVADFRALDIRRWAREGVLERPSTFNWNWQRDGKVVADIDCRTEPGRVWLSYRSRPQGGEWTQRHYAVGITTTPCHFGGVRHWFICPAQGCGRRVARLYGGAVYACRQCHALAYPSQRERAGDRAVRRADKIRQRLGWSPGILNDGFKRPKGMHRKTFSRLCRNHARNVDFAVSSIMARFGPDPLLDDYITALKGG